MTEDLFVENVWIFLWVVFQKISKSWNYVIFAVIYIEDFLLFLERCCERVWENLKSVTDLFLSHYLLGALFYDEVETVNSSISNSGIAMSWKMNIDFDEFDPEGTNFIVLKFLKNSDREIDSEKR